MQDKTAMSERDKTAYINSLCKNPKYSEEMVQLVKSDLDRGLSKAETEEYSGSGLYDYQQMCVYSQCLHKGYSQEAREIILKDSFSVGQMEAAAEFYEKGVPLATVAEIVGNAGQDVSGMRHRLEQVLEKKQEAKKAEETETENQSQDRSHMECLLKQIQETLEKLSLQEEKYAALDKKIQELQTEKQDAAVQERLLAQLAEREKMLADQQDQLNGAMAEVAKLKNELGKAKAGEQAEEKEKKQSAGTVQITGKQTSPAKLQEKKPARAGKPEPWADPVSRVGYQAAVLDRNGKVVQFIPIEHTKKKEDARGLSSLFSRLLFRRRLDIVKLLAGKNLELEQLVQVRNAIEKGLEERQLLTLVNSGLPAEQMEEIINIAVYENNGTL